MGMLAAEASAKIIYVAPDGVSSNSGTKTSPWNLQKALLKSSAVGGDFIYLRGGVYRGSFTSELVGAAGNPITVMSAPGEWAVIDGNQTIGLTNTIGATGSATVTLTPGANLPDVAVVMIDNEHMQLVKVSGDTYSINARGWDGTQPAAHTAGSAVRAVAEILTINGSNVVFQNFEVTDSKQARVIAVTGSNSVDFNRRYTGISVYAPNCKIINTVVHDTYQGITFWSQSTDSEVYGNILYNNGEEAPDRGHGHGIYTQNTTGRKVIQDNIIFGNFGGFGVHVYGTSAATLRGYSLIGNVQFLDRWLVGGNAPADDITISDNYLYGYGFELGYGNQDNGTAKLIDNYSYAGVPADIKWWKQLTMTGNRFYHNGDSQGADLILTQPVGSSVLSQYQINNNRYIFGKSFMDVPFYINTSGASTPYSFLQWKALGFDAGGSWSGATAASTSIVKPSGLDIFYRANKYEAGRANVVIYNYNNASSVSVDLSKTGLTAGQSFEIRNGQNYNAAPVASGTYNGQSVTVNLTGLRIAQPSGNSTFYNSETCPQFCVLVVTPKTAASSAPSTSSVPAPTAPAPTPTPTPTPTPAPTPTPTPTSSSTTSSKDTVTKDVAVKPTPTPTPTPKILLWFRNRKGLSNH